ncbi:hypothetical protein BDW75DRAFT_127291 [Aspergillus navahoensis]
MWSSHPKPPKHSAQSCLPCREKKRKCDRRLPVCSRCQRSRHQCLYGNGSFGFCASSVPAAGEEVIGIRSLLASGTTAPEPPLLKPSKACYNCKHAKKHCDRTQPSCARCTRRCTRCIYDHFIELEHLRTHHFFSSSLTTKTVNCSIDYPIRSHAHIPMLIRFFQDKQGLSPFRVEPYSLAYYLRSTWISHALADPCLLHATLFSASVQLDMLTGAQQSSYATLYHQFNAVRLLRSRLAMAALNNPDDATVASVLLLAIHGSLQLDRESTEVHRQGLLQIVATRGGLDKLGFDGFLAHLTQASLSFLAIVFDQPEPFPIPECEASVGPHNLICLVLKGFNESPNEQLRQPLLNLFRDIQQLAREACTDSEALPSATNIPLIQSLLDRLWSETDPALSGQPPALSKKEFALLRACTISGRILAYLLDDRLPWSEQQLDQFLEELQDAIDLTERATWLKHGPEANMWVAVVGAAMCKDIGGRASFILKENCVASAIRGTDWSRYVAARFCYRWLKDKRLARCASLQT